MRDRGTLCSDFNNLYFVVDDDEPEFLKARGMGPMGACACAKKTEVAQKLAS